MNIPKPLSRQTDLDRRLHTSFSRWAEQQIPPVNTRRELLKTVRHEAESQGHISLRQPSDGFIETVYLGPVITFNHCFSMFYSLHSRVRL